MSWVAAETLMKDGRIGFSKEISRVEAEVILQFDAEAKYTWNR